MPELTVRDLATSLRFWRDLLGFQVVYSRESFAFLERAGAQFMLEERNTSSWITGTLEPPHGRGIHFEIAVGSIEPLLSALRDARHPLWQATEERWYRVGDDEIGQRQFLVQDPEATCSASPSRSAHAPRAEGEARSAQ